MTTADRPPVNRRRLIAIIAASVVFVLLCVAALYAGAARGASQAATATPTTSASAPAPASTTRAVPSTLPTSTPIRSCSVSALAKSAALGTFVGDVTDVDSGKVMFTRDGTTAEPTASLFKLITASAAIKILGPDYRLTTTVVAGDEPGTIVLVGGGDPTLSATAVGAQSVYKNAPKLADLAAQVIAKYNGQVVTKIVLDSSYWSSADSWNPNWKRSVQTDGYQSEVTALQVDGDRATPTKQVSPRSSDPVMAAGTAFAKALGVPAAALEVGTAPANAALLGSVESQPVSSLIKTMLLNSDGSLAESLARVTSKVAGSDGSAASLQEVDTTALTALGLDMKGVVVNDGSGLSAKDGVPARTLNKLLALLHDGANNLNYVYDGLSLAGSTGGLKTRFTGDNAVARGHVTGKVGHIDNEYSLAGVVEAADGTELAFTFYALGKVGESATTALDTLTTAVYSCGANLSNK